MNPSGNLPEGRLSPVDRSFSPFDGRDSQGGSAAPELNDTANTGVSGEMMSPQYVDPLTKHPSWDIQAKNEIYVGGTLIFLG